MLKVKYISLILILFCLHLVLNEAKESNVKKIKNQKAQLDSIKLKQLFNSNVIILKSKKLFDKKYQLEINENGLLVRMVNLNKPKFSFQRIL